MKVDNGKLRFQGPGIDATKFGLRAIDNVRPGDDYLLRFGLYDKAGVLSPTNLLTSGTIPESQVPAVYDKKLLWRANLYIDTGADDWNNINPGTSVQGNAWDARGDGKQSTIQPWTRMALWLDSTMHRTITCTTTRWSTSLTISDAVAYSRGAYDSPSDFNIDMGEQKQALALIYDKDGKQTSLPQRWNTTYAPLNDWAKYSSSSYIPGWSEYRYVEVGERISLLAAADMVQAAGVDCLTLTLRVAGYDSGNGEAAYLAGAKDDYRETIASSRNSGNGITSSTSWPIFNGDGAYGALTPGDYGDYCEYLKVGDLVRFQGHVAMISQVDRGYMQTGTDQIHLIESADWRQLKVQNNHTLKDYIDAGIPPLSFVRLIPR